ncbi:MAG TPA: hypothetical protein VFC65_15815 [Prolixibacteraceae bacterium]|nr:hypothetical protein [Prolixibacteraceae bacterium]
MKQLKSLAVVLLIILVLLALVLVRNSDQNLFKQDVNTAIEAVQSGSNKLSPDQFKNSGSPGLVVNLGNENMPDSLLIGKTISIPFENLLDLTNRKILKEVKGNIILYSADAATTAKAWFILNQLGFENIYILSSGDNPEVLKYKFQPDTTARLEQDSV